MFTLGLQLLPNDKANPAINLQWIILYSLWCIITVEFADNFMLDEVSDIAEDTDILVTSAIGINLDACSLIIVICLLFRWQ